MIVLRGAGLALLLAAQVSVAAAAAPALDDYVVQPGDSCHSIAVKRYGDARRVDLIHANNTMGPAPHHLKPGMHLKLPPQASGQAAADAQLTFVRNHVQAYTPEEHAGTRNEELRRGNRVATLAASSAEVTFVDETQLQLGEHTLVVILGASSNEAQKHATAEDTTLLSGSLRAHLGELVGRKPKTLATPAGRITLGAGDAKVDVDDKRATRLAVYRGRSKLRASGREVEVPDGFGSKADQGKPPTPPRPLPPPPTWATPLPRLVLAPDGTADVAGDYAAGSGPGPAVAGWHVQLGRDEKLNDLVFDVQLPADVTRLSAQALPPGRYFARVAAIDGDRFEGKPGPTATVQVVAVKVQAPEGAADGTLAVADGLACGLDGAPLTPVNGPLAPAAGRHVLACALTPDAAPATVTLVTAAGTRPPPPPPPPPPPVAPAPPPPPPPPPAPRRVGFELGGALGFGVTGPGAAGADVGPLALFELGMRLRFGDNQLALGLRGGGEAYPGAHFDVGQLALPLSLRFGPPEARAVPYLGFLPALLFVPRSGPIDVELQLGALAGVLLRLPDGKLFLEAQYRHAVWQRFDAQAAPNGFLFLIGWRGDL